MNSAVCAMGRLRTTRLAVGLWTKDAPVSLVHCAQQIAVGLRVYKLVYLDPNGGLVRDGHRLSCLTEPGLHDLLRRGARISTARRPVLEAIHAALAGGVTSVSLCPLAGIGQELLTYEEWHLIHPGRVLSDREAGNR